MQRHLATASSLLISAAIREMIPQHSESSPILTTVTIPDGENIHDHNGPSCQCLPWIVLGTAGDRHQLVAWRDLQGVAAKLMTLMPQATGGNQSLFFRVTTSK